jgi:hypothetical protein
LTPKDCLKEIAADILTKLGYAEVKILGFSYNTVKEANSRIDALGDYQALDAVISIETKIREFRKRPI